MAFAVLVERHGPMVLRTCLAILRDEHDARDAFQATFLILARRGGSLWVRDSIGPWLHRAARHAAIVRSGNMSLGVNIMLSVVEEIAKRLGPDWDVEIVEMHHRGKADAPSGTAITLREIVQAAQPGTEVEVTSHRVGDAKGEHVVTAKSEYDVLELRHDAHSRRGFALGAVRAAEWLAGQGSGVWDFREIFDRL